MRSSLHKPRSVKGRRFNEIFKMNFTPLFKTSIRDHKNHKKVIMLEEGVLSKGRLKGEMCRLTLHNPMQKKWNQKISYGTTLPINSLTTTLQLHISKNSPIVQPAAGL